MEPRRESRTGIEFWREGWSREFPFVTCFLFCYYCCHFLPAFF